ncbi:hypothetical protein FRB90_006341 [Tulasnella sp. 427]|nr:hypothetical protein FRB90_006341 [Tulasnella sp. 427]
MSFLTSALPLAQHSTTNLAFLTLDAKEYATLVSDVRALTSPSPTPTLSKPSSEFIRPSYESRWSESSANHPNNTRSLRRRITFADYDEEDEDANDDLELDYPPRSPRATYHSAYAVRSSLSLGHAQALYFSSATAAPPPPIPPFPSEYFPEGLPRKYTPSPSPVVGQFDPNTDDVVTRSRRSVAASLKKQLKRMFKKRSASVARAL